MFGPQLPLGLIVIDVGFGVGVALLVVNVELVELAGI